MKNKKTSQIFIRLFLAILLCLPLYGCQQPSLQSVYSSSSMPTRPASALYPFRTFEEAVSYATTIVYGEITAIRPTCKEIFEATSPDTTDSFNIITPIEISPIEVLKGENTPPVVYKRLGGEYEGVRYVQEGDDMNLQVGQKILVFLNAYNYDLGPDWVMVEENGQVQYYDDDSQELVNIPTEDYLQKIREQVA